MPINFMFFFSNFITYKCSLIVSKKNTGAIKIKTTQKKTKQETTSKNETNFIDICANRFAKSTIPN